MEKPPVNNNLTRKVAKRELIKEEIKKQLRSKEKSIL